MRYTIFRCRGHATLALAALLRGRCLSVEAPLWTQTRRTPRSKKRVTFEYPLLPSFLFVAEEQTGKAKMLGRNPHHRCWPFIINGVVATVPEDQVARITETVSDVATPIIRGTKCQVLDGPFTGWSVIVAAFDGQYYNTRCEKTGLTIKIPPFMLRPHAL